MCLAFINSSPLVYAKGNILKNRGGQSIGNSSLRLSRQALVFKRPLVCCEGQESEPSSSKKIKSKKPASSSKAGYHHTKEEMFPERGSGSRPPLDLRPSSLKNNEETSHLCSACNGTGEMFCCLCEGTDFYAKDGSGKVICPGCNDKKKLRCTFCYGTGKSIQLVENWWETTLYKQVDK
eukprot:jgi/Galph1/4029/GphlegSOOS_G2702.1